MRGGKERNDKHRKQNRMYFHNSTCSFSSYNPVISGVWEQRWAASINVWRSGIHHRPRSIETSSYLKCMSTIQSSLSQPTIKTTSWPRSFFLCDCAVVQCVVMRQGQLQLASTGLFQQQGGNSIHREGGKEGQWHVTAKNIACQAWRNVAARGVGA